MGRRAGRITRNDRGNASLVAGFLGVIFLALAGRFAFHQVLPRDGLAMAARSQGARPSWRIEKTLAEHPRRGLICDRNGRTLAVSWYEHVLVVDPTELSKGITDDEARALVRELPLLVEDVGAELLPRWCGNEAALQRALFLESRHDASGRRIKLRHRVLTRGLEPEVHRLLKKSLEAAELPGFSFDRCIRRTYPAGAAFAQVVGIVGRNSKDCFVSGRSGIEQAFEEWLGGDVGQLSSELDGQGRELIRGAPWARPPSAGADVVLTLDSEIQRTAYEILEEHCREHETRTASALVLCVRTGEILAVCSYPSADPERLDGTSMEALNLSALQDLYTPGSTIKPVFLSWALSTGAVTPTETFDCGGVQGWRRFGRRTVKEYSPNPEPLDVAGIIMRSSNVGAVRIGMERLGLDAMYAALEAFSVLRRPGVAYPCVPMPRFTQPEKAKWGYTGPMFPQGYEMAVTPLTMARVYLTLARGGEEIEPTLIKELRTDGGVLRAEMRPRRVIAARAVSRIARAMRDVVESERGTGHVAKSARWLIAAKTGTGQDDRALGNGVYNAWFCSMAPATDPEIVVVVHTQLKRRKGRPYTGGRVSGPPARKLIEKTLEYLRVPPDRPGGGDG